MAASSSPFSPPCPSQSPWPPCPQGDEKGEVFSIFRRGFWGDVVQTPLNMNEFLAIAHDLVGTRSQVEGRASSGVKGTPVTPATSAEVPNAGCVAASACSKRAPSYTPAMAPRKLSRRVVQACECKRRHLSKRSCCSGVLRRLAIATSELARARRREAELRRRLTDAEIERDAARRQLGLAPEAVALACRTASLWPARSRTQNAEEGVAAAASSAASPLAAPSAKHVRRDLTVA